MGFMQSPADTRFPSSEGALCNAEAESQIPAGLSNRTVPLTGQLSLSLHTQEVSPPYTIPLHSTFIFLQTIPFFYNINLDVMSLG